MNISTQREVRRQAKLQRNADICYNDERTYRDPRPISLTIRKLKLDVTEIDLFVSLFRCYIFNYIPKYSSSRYRSIFEQIIDRFLDPSVESIEEQNPVLVAFKNPSWIPFAPMSVGAPGFQGKKKDS